jgi:hypothetical protein
MKWDNWRIYIGVFILVVGLLVLLQNLNLFHISEIIWPILIGVLFILGGAAFISMLVSNPSNWWAAIPGVTLMAIGLEIATSALFPNFINQLGGLIIIGGIGLSFWLVYLLDKQKWWAIIPGGTMLTIASISVSPDILGGRLEFLKGGAFFLGIGITFALLYVLPTGGTRLNWAWIPAVVLLVIGALISLSEAGVMNVIWPLALIIAGIFLIYRAVVRRT